MFGEGNPDAQLALVGEAPGFHEDRSGTPFAGRSRDLLARLLEGIGLSLDDVYMATALKCRTPGNRDPLPEETSACEPYLYRQLELVRPRVVATLGSFATTLLSGRALGITRIHGQEQQVALGGGSMILYPLYHPAAALYMPAMLEVLERDFARLGELVSGAGGLGGDLAPSAPPFPEPTAGASARKSEHPREIQVQGRRPVQLGLF